MQSTIPLCRHRLLRTTRKPRSKVIFWNPELDTVPLQLSVGHTYHVRKPEHMRPRNPKKVFETKFDISPEIEQRILQRAKDRADRADRALTAQQKIGKAHEVMNWLALPEDSDLYEKDDELPSERDADNLSVPKILAQGFILLILILAFFGFIWLKAKIHVHFIHPQPAPAIEITPIKHKSVEA